MKRIISILLENKPGALARVVGLFHQRGYNIESLNVGPVFDGTYSRMTVTSRGSENDVEQITKQINKIIDVIKVSDLTEGEHHEYEFILIKYNKFKLTPKIQKILKPLSGKVLEKNTDRQPKPKYKGAPEDIYEKFANSVVYIENRKDNGSGSGFVINHNGIKIIRMKPLLLQPEIQSKII